MSGVVMAAKPNGKITKLSQLRGKRVAVKLGLPVRNMPKAFIRSTGLESLLSMNLMICIKMSWLATQPPALKIASYEVRRSARH